MERNSFPSNGKKALKYFIFNHLFKSKKLYNSVGNKRKRSSLNLPNNKQAKLTESSEIITLDDSQEENVQISNTDDDEEEEKLELNCSQDQNSKLLILLLKHLKTNEIPISLEQHLKTFIIPTLHFYESSEPLLYKSSKNQLYNICDEFNIISNSKNNHNISINSDIIDLDENDDLIDSIHSPIGDNNDNSPPSQVSKKNQSLLNGNYEDIQNASKEMNVPISFLQQFLHLLQIKKQLIFRGPPGTGKSFIAKVKIFILRNFNFSN